VICENISEEHAQQVGKLFLIACCVYGISILTDMVEVRQQLGYCPQFDALCSLLTVDEHLTMYARLRGIAEKDVVTVSYICMFATHACM